MWEPGTSSHTHVLAVRRVAPLAGYFVIGFYLTDHDAFSAFRKHRLKSAILFHIDHYAHDSKLPKEYVDVN